MKVFATLALFLFAIIGFAHAAPASLRANTANDEDLSLSFEEGHRFLKDCNYDSDCPSSQYCSMGSYDAQGNRGRVCVDVTGAPGGVARLNSQREVFALPITCVAAVPVSLTGACSNVLKCSFKETVEDWSEEKGKFNSQDG